MSRVEEQELWNIKFLGYAILRWCRTKTVRRNRFLGLNYLNRMPQIHVDPSLNWLLPNVLVMIFCVFDVAVVLNQFLIIGLVKRYNANEYWAKSTRTHINLITCQITFGRLTEVCIEITSKFDYVAESTFSLLWLKVMTVCRKKTHKILNEWIDDVKWNAEKMFFQALTPSTPSEIA